jgi:hypothetical protein
MLEPYCASAAEWKLNGPGAPRRAMAPVTTMHRAG